MKTNNWCEPACYNEACGYDNGACDGQCNPGCPSYWIGDNICDSYCMTDACENDRGDWV
jgi:hypothetical protein